MPYILNLQNNKNQAEPEKDPVPQKQPAEQPANQLPASLSWQAAEYEHKKKSTDWYWAVGILTIGFFGVAIVFENVLFSILVLLAGFAIALYGAKPPRMVSFVLSVEGIRIQNRVYPYESLKSFWIFYHPEHVKELSIESQKLIMPHVKIPLGDMNPVEVRAYLQQFLPERHQEESLIDVGTRFLGF